MASTQSLRRCVVVLLAVTTWAYRSVAADAERGPYTHLAYQRMASTDKGTLNPEVVLHRIAPLSDALKKQAQRVVTSSRGLTGNGIHSVSRGKLLVSGFREKATFVDVATGEPDLSITGSVESLISHPNQNAVFYTTPQFTRVSQLDIESQNVSVLVQGSMQRSRSFATHTHSRIALSPDGDQLAAATFVGSQPGVTLAHLFEIHLVDLRANPPKSRLLGQEFAGINVSTGGGNHVYGPAMFWTDESTLLIAAPPTPEGDGTKVVALDNRHMSLFELNAQTDQVRTVCELPFQSFSMMTQFDPEFWQRDDGALMMRSKHLGDHRIDLKAEKVIVDRRLSTQYEFRGDTYKPSLWAGEKQLAERVNTWDVSVSPDGKQIAWLVPVHANQYGWTHAEKSFSIHSARTGTIDLGRVRLDLMKSRPHHPVENPPILWLTDEDLQSAP